MVDVSEVKFTTDERKLLGNELKDAPPSWINGIVDYWIRNYWIRTKRKWGN